VAIISHANLSLAAAIRQEQCAIDFNVNPLETYVLSDIRNELRNACVNLRVVEHGGDKEGNLTRRMVALCVQTLPVLGDEISLEVLRSISVNSELSFCLAANRLFHQLWKLMIWLSNGTGHQQMELEAAAVKQAKQFLSTDSAVWEAYTSGETHSYEMRKEGSSQLIRMIDSQALFLSAIVFLCFTMALVTMKTIWNRCSKYRSLRQRSQVELNHSAV